MRYHVNLFTTELSRVCRERFLQEKWLISPSLRAGHQWLDALTWAGGPVVNVRIKTIKGMALELAGPEIARLGVTAISGTATQVIAESILDQLQSNPDSYLASLHAGPTLSQNLAQTISSLRLSGTAASRLDPSCFEAPAKGNDLALALESYQSILSANKLVDYADILRMAVARLKSQDSALPANVVALVPHDLELAYLERVLVEAFPENKRFAIPVDQPGQAEAESGEEETDARLLRWILHPADAPKAREDGTANIFRAVGEVNEIRHVLRSCLSRGHRLDEVEILHTDARVYVPLMYETFVNLSSEGATDPQDLPVTFAEGLPARYSRPGRGLIAFMNWIRDGYPQATLARMIQDGLLKLPVADPEQFSYSDVAKAFRAVPIITGRERYMPAMTEALAELETQLAKANAGEGGEVDGNAVSAKLDTMKLLIDLVTQLLDISPTDPGYTGELLQTAVKYLEDHAAGDNQLDNYARNSLLDSIRDMAQWTDRVSPRRSVDFLDWLAFLPDGARVCGSGPRPGCIHMAHVLSGGHSARPHTFIVGLDDGRFPGLGLNDPLLLDKECERISPHLPKASVRLGMKLEAFARLLARLRGTIDLGFSCHDLLDDRESFAGSLLFSAYRILSNNREGDHADMLKWLPPATSFSPESPDRCLNETEWWLWRFCGAEAVANPQEVLARRFPHLGQGLVAAAARSGDKFTVYDGLTPHPAPELDPRSPEGPIMSASMLETIGRCPLRYFFKYVLDVQLPDEPTLDPTRWLDPLEFGNLLHDLFYRFMNELLRQRRLPLVSRDRPLLMKLLHERVGRYAKKIPPPNSSAFRQQVIQLIRAADIFLTEEEELSRASRPVFLEASIGMRPYAASTALDTEEPVSVPLSQGKSIRVRGRIDRIDLLNDDSSSTYSIWDYKSGSPIKYGQEDVFAQGRVIQHALYLYMAAVMLRKKVSPRAEVKHFGYFFPSVGARGLRIMRWREQVAQARRIIDNLCETVGRGCFIATDNWKEDCRFCDYAAVCGDIAAVAESSKRKLNNPVNTDLRSMRELRDSGK
jgi:ATP-dependent helicase/nuclease subunit B